MRSKKKIGIFDSGLGGLTVLRSCIDAINNQKFEYSEIDFIYLGDNARVPYGSKSPATIKKYGVECAAFLKSKNVDSVIVACNTVSAYAIAEIEQTLGQSVIETISPAVEVALRNTKTKNIGIIGTAATCASGAYEKAIKNNNSEIIVTSIACPLFVPLVEQGMFEGEIVDKVIKLYLEPLKNSKVDTIILGCTHYPLLYNAIDNFFNGSITLVTCSDAIADHLLQKMRIEDQNDNSTKSPSSRAAPNVQFYVTDELSYFNSLATKCLNGIEVNAQLAEFTKPENHS